MIVIIIMIIIIINVACRSCRGLRFFWLRFDLVPHFGLLAWATAVFFCMHQTLASYTILFASFCLRPQYAVESHFRDFGDFIVVY